MNNLDSSNKISIDNLPQKPLLHKLEENKLKLSRKSVYIIGAIIFSGVLSGFLLSTFTKKGTETMTSGEKSQVSGKKVVGSTDTKTFRDSTEGVLESGGIDGEGTHKLIRPGGESQTVYLTSSVLDLNQFVGKKVKVWGETHGAKKAGWLMDVGKVEVI